MTSSSLSNGISVQDIMGGPGPVMEPTGLGAAFNTLAKTYEREGGAQEWEAAILVARFDSDGDMELNICEQEHAISTISTENTDMIMDTYFPDNEAGDEKFSRYAAVHGKKSAELGVAWDEWNAHNSEQLEDYFNGKLCGDVFNK